MRVPPPLVDPRVQLVALVFELKYQLGLLEATSPLGRVVLELTASGGEGAQKLVELIEGEVARGGGAAEPLELVVQ